MNSLFSKMRDGAIAIAWLILLVTMFFAGIGMAFGVLYRFFRWAGGL